MKQVLQDLRNGTTAVRDVPAPGAGPGRVLIRTRASLISAGTERMLVEFGRASLLAKARSQPEKVKQVLDKIKTDGLLPTLEAVFSKLGEPMPLGYCNVGVVLDVGAGVTGLAPGDRVASNGPHAEVVCVPKNLCAKIPDDVTDEQAACTVLGSIALQGIRLVGPALGERVAVVGLGLVGLLAVQLLRASGCEVLGVDLNPDRLALAESLGAKTVDVAAGGDPVAAAAAWTNGAGVDAVLIAAATKTDEIVHQAAEMCRKRGRIVLVGVVGLNLRRSDFYAKELTFQVSCSYGPGRYDEAYEQGGRDYPPGFVRWTEQRNFQAVLEAMSAGRLAVDALITHRFPQADAARAYESIRTDRKALGVLLEYPSQVNEAREIVLSDAPASPAAGTSPTLGVIGAGNFAKGILVPSLAKTGCRLAYVADLDGTAAQTLAARHGAARAVTDYRMILADDAVDAVLIVVGHHLHAKLICEALSAGKHCFTEKPLALNAEELQRVAAALAAAPGRQLMVGFNRRFSPHVVRARQLLSARSEPLCMTYTVNAGPIPPDHWVHDPDRGGGRIVGEACHFIDLLAHLAGSKVVRVSAARVGEGPAVRDDKMSIVLALADGSVGTVNYFANGSKSYPKETVEIFSDRRVLRLDNFRRLRGYGFKGFGGLKTFRQDKGHAAELKAFVDRVAAGGEALIPFDELANATRASFAAVASAASGETIRL